MKKLLSISLLLLSTMLLEAQQNSIWSLPPNYAKWTGNVLQPPIALPKPTIGFFGNPNTLAGGLLDGYDGQIPEYAHNAIQDKNGDLLFFIVDGYIFDHLGRTIARINQFTSYQLPELSGANELLVVPDPENCSKYYIFGDMSVTTPISNASSPMYTSIDLSDPNTVNLLNLTTQNIIVPNPPNAFNRNVHNKYAASKLRPDNSRLVFINAYSYLHIFKIDATGVSFVQTIIPNPSNSAFFPQAEILDNRSELEVIETTNNLNQLIYRVAYSYSTSANSWIVINADIDYNSLNLNTGTDEYIELLKDNFNVESNIHGLEFSPDASKLFFTHETNQLNPNAIEYHIIGSGNNTKQPIIVNNAQEFQFTQIELAKDGAMYFVGEQNNTGNRLAKLSNPNTVSGWLDYTVSVNYNYSIAGGVSNGAPHKKLYLLPDQIDGMNYADHFTANVECCIANTTFSTGTDQANYQQYGVQTWNTTTTGNNPFGTNVITVRDELIIKQGANIVANGLRFEFAPDAKLVVEQGAIFTINTCTLTVENTCENAPMWNGIEVHGPSANQQAADAGRFIVNNSLIEHSYLGAHNYKTYKSGTPGVFWEDYNYPRGGVILATNTTFRNNHRATVFFDFQNNNPSGSIDDESKFNNCTFVTDAKLNKPNLTPTVIMAHMFGVQGVNFLGCDFKFTSTDLSIAAHERGSGIEANTCLLTVTSRPTGGVFIDRSTFQHLTRGIESYSNSSVARTTKVTNTDFENVWRCVYLKSNNYATILNNTFNVASGNAWGYDSYGLNLDHCDKYKVENNNFNTTSIQNGYLGVHVYNSGINNNEIYRNTFDNLTVASQAAQINGNYQTPSEQFGTGLELRCNTYTNTKNYDIAVSSGLIRPFNGQCINLLTPVNNKFSYTTGLEGDVYVASGLNAMSYQHSIGPNLAPRPLYYSTPGVNPTICNNVYNEIANCPLKSKKTKSVLLDELAIEKNVVIDLNQELEAGNAKDLYEAIQSQTAGNVKNTLMAASPYLSDNVLLAYLQSNPPNGHLQQILLANSPLSQAILDAIQQSNLPKGIKNQIIAAQTGASAIQELTAEISYHKSEVTKIQNDVIRHILFEDDVIERYKEAITFIKQESACIEKQCELIEFYISDKNFVEAEIELLDLAQEASNEDLVKIYDNIIQLEQVVSIDQEMVNNMVIQNSIKEVADVPGQKKAKAMAEVLLKRAKLRVNQEIIEPLFNGSNARLINLEEQTTLSSEIQTLNAITVYPNPTSNLVNVGHNLNQENGKVVFKVYNMLGVEVLNETLITSNNEIKINNLKSGVYFYTITQNNKTIKTDKLMVR